MVVIRDSVGFSAGYRLRYHDLVYSEYVGVWQWYLDSTPCLALPSIFRYNAVYVGREHAFAGCGSCCNSVPWGLQVTSWVLGWNISKIPEPCLIDARHLSHWFLLLSAHDVKFDIPISLAKPLAIKAGFQLQGAGATRRRTGKSRTCLARWSPERPTPASPRGYKNRGLSLRCGLWWKSHKPSIWSPGSVVFD